MIARGIEEKLVKEAISRGGKRLQNPDKIVSDYRHFSVVYKKRRDVYFVITVMPRW